MKNQRKGFFAGMVTMALIVAMVGSAFAAYQKTATLDYTGIKITLDGQAVTPTDANGNMIEPFAIDGTTYLPVRGIANALGLGVDWNQDTQTVVLTSGGSASSQQSQTASTGTVIYNENGIKVTYTGVEVIELAGNNCIYINMYIDNTSSEAVSMLLDDCSVNNIMRYTLPASAETRVLSQKSAYMSYGIYKLDGLTITSASDISTLEFKLSIYNPDTFETLYTSDTITITP